MQAETVRIVRGLHETAIDIADSEIKAEMVRIIRAQNIT